MPTSRRVTADGIESHPIGVFQQPHYDTYIYRWRHLIENYFAKIKEFRAIATRYDKTVTSFRATISFAAAIIVGR